MPDSALPCFAAFGDQTANQLRDRFQPALTHSLIGDYVNSLIDNSLGSNWTRLYDSVRSFLRSRLSHTETPPFASVPILLPINFIMTNKQIHVSHLSTQSYKF